MVISGEGSASPGTITFTEPGTYTYHVKEIQGTAVNCLYDSSEYTLSYVVTKATDSLIAAPIIAKNNQNTDELLFTNSYFLEKVSPTAIKSVQGSANGPTAAESYGFTFRGVSMTELDGTTPLSGSMPMPAGAIGQEKALSRGGECHG